MKNYRFFRLSKLNWSQRKWWWGYLKTDIRNWYYRTFRGIDFNCRNVHSSTMPKYGKVVQKHAKGIVQINDPKGSGDFVRIIPVDYNWGISVEIWKNGELCGGSLLDYAVLTNILYAHVEHNGDLTVKSLKEWTKREDERHGRVPSPSESPTDRIIQKDEEPRSPR